jgi:hypothetical protein
MSSSDWHRIGKTKWAIRLSICGFKWSHIALGLTHSTITKSSTPDYTSYAKTFISTFAPEILKGYLTEIG